MIKSILFKVQLTGRGVVNYDSNDQKYVWNALTKEDERVRFDNVIFAKHRWYRDGGVTQRKIVISGDCLRHNIFERDFMFQSPNVFAHRVLLNQMIASVGSLLRGYMFANEGTTTLRRKSAIAITEAQQTNSAVSAIETFSRSGKKESRADENDTADNSFFKRETVGDISYEALGVVDLKELQFISLSDMYDRMAVNADDFAPIYKGLLEKALGSAVADPAYYTLKGSAIQLPEYGVLLSKVQIIFLVREFFKRLAAVSIQKASQGIANVSEVSLKLVTDPVRDRMDSTEGWSKLDDIDRVSFDPDFFYQQVDPTDAKKVLVELEERLAVLKSAGKEKKIAEKAEKAKKKEEKATAKKKQGA